MARKKSRPANRFPATEAQALPSDGITAAPPMTPAASTAIVDKSAVRTGGTTVAAKPEAEQERAWIETVAVRASRVFGSLQLAIPLLVFFTLAVLLGTMMEHYYNTRVAQVLVYKSWWFVLLLALLAVNIFCAAAKKWPFKKYQTGFVVTHIGLLTMLSGGVLHWAYGTDAQIQLLDTPDLQTQEIVKRSTDSVSQATTRASYSEISEIRIHEEVGRKPQDAIHAGMHGRERGEYKTVTRDFEPGPLPWRAENRSFSSDMLLGVMTWLSSPFGYGWSTDLEGGARLEAIDFLPYARREHYTKIEKGGFPAVKLKLRSARFGQPLEEWLAFDVRNLEARSIGFGRGMPAAVEFLGFCPTGLLQEFLDPPAEKELGKKGVLSVVLPGSRSVRVSVDANLDRVANIEGERLQVRVTKYMPDVFDAAPGDDRPGDPGLEFEVLENGRKVGAYKIMARFVGMLLDLEGKGGVVPQSKVGAAQFWYHPPDFRGGREGVRGVLQFVQGDNGGLYYRAFSVRNDALTVEGSGPVRPGGEETPIWDKMQWKFTVLEHYTQASAAERYTPAPVVAGKETDEDKFLYSPAVQFRLTVGKQSKEFWVTSRVPGEAVVGGRRFVVQHANKLKPLGFELVLERAEQTVDPGTRAAASYSSYVQVNDDKAGVHKRFQITMNEPLEYGGFKFYQSNYNFLDMYDANGRPVSISGFTVGHDPGLRLKYLGSLMLGAGIFIMFYMKAYFFKPRGRRTASAARPAAQPSPV